MSFLPFIVKNGAENFAPFLLHYFVTGIYGEAVMLKCQWLKCAASICTRAGLIQAGTFGIGRFGEVENLPSTSASLMNDGPM